VGGHEAIDSKKSLGTKRVSDCIAVFLRNRSSRPLLKPFSEA
jgi:hypothetical protein